MTGGIMAKDPVCGMQVDEKTAPAKTEYKGRTYYFCMQGCKTKFEQNPERYAGRD
jgi:YHS domain-containing protein